MRLFTAAHQSCGESRDEVQVSNKLRHIPPIVGASRPDNLSFPTRGKDAFVVQASASRSYQFVSSAVLLPLASQLILLATIATNTAHWLPC